MVALLDMDEVLTDFVGGALRVHGWDRQRLEQVWEPGSWSIVEPMGLTVDEFFEPINAEGEEFWCGLQPSPWARRMTNLLDLRLPGAWYIASSPSRSPGAYSGKVKWIKRFLGQAFDRVVITPHKELLARKDALLIDDREETIVKFRKLGALGIVFPCRHNRLYKITDPVEYVTEQLDRYL